MTRVLVSVGACRVPASFLLFEQKQKQETERDEGRGTALDSKGQGRVERLVLVR